MRTLKMVYRLFRVFAMVYMLWKAFMRGRFLAVGIALFRLLTSRNVARDPKYVADFTFVNAGEPAIYRRQGIRRILSRRD